MCPSNILKALLFCILLSALQKLTQAAPNSRQIDNNNHIRSTGIRYPTRSVNQIQYSRARQEPFPDFLGDDDDLFDMIKRQSDDYGHMRFGKREFDDYGHMRFGKSVPEN